MAWVCGMAATCWLHCRWDCSRWVATCSLLDKWLIEGGTLCTTLHALHHPFINVFLSSLRHSRHLISHIEWCLASRINSDWPFHSFTATSLSEDWFGYQFWHDRFLIGYQTLVMFSHASKILFLKQVKRWQGDKAFCRITTRQVVNLFQEPVAQEVAFFTEV